MNKEQYVRFIKDCDLMINGLVERKREATKEFIEENAPFKVGDKVRVYNTNFNKEETMREAAISRIKVSSYGVGEIKYEFVKIKKDGNISQQSAGIYSWDRLELIPQ